MIHVQRCDSHDGPMAGSCSLQARLPMRYCCMRKPALQAALAICSPDPVRQFYTSAHPEDPAPAFFLKPANLLVRPCTERPLCCSHVLSCPRPCCSHHP